MEDISIQFHALPQEQNAFIGYVVGTLGAEGVGVTLHPFSARAIVEAEIAGSEQLPFDRIAFCARAYVGGGASFDELSKLNPGCLILDLGKLDPAGLHEAWLAIRSNDEVAMAKWKLAAKELLRRTKAGATAVNPRTGASSRLRSHRYSAAALELFNSGTTMLPVAGSSVLRFGG